MSKPNLLGLQGGSPELPWARAQLYGGAYAKIEAFLRKTNEKPMVLGLTGGLSRAPLGPWASCRGGHMPKWRLF